MDEKQLRKLAGLPLNEVQVTKAGLQSAGENLRDLKKKQIAFDKIASKKWRKASGEMAEALALTDLSMHLQDVIDEFGSGDFGLGPDPFGEVLAEAKKRALEIANYGGEEAEEFGKEIYRSSIPEIQKVRKF